MKHVILAVIVALGFAACKKKTITYTISGTVTDNSFSQPLSGATAQLFEYPVGSASPSTSLGTVTIGADGTYSFEFERTKVEKYLLVINKNNYFPISKEFTADQLTPNETTSFSLATTAKAWVKLHFVNSGDLNDLEYYKQAGKTDCAECCPAGEQVIYAQPETIRYCINDGNAPYSIVYLVPGTPNFGTLSVNTTPFDTTELLLNY